MVLRRRGTHYWLTGHDDLLRLIHNTLRWLTHNERRVTVEGEGFVEMFCWETAPGYAVHLLNYTNPNAFRGWMQSVTKLGPQRVSMKLPGNVRAKKVELLRAEKTIPFDATRPATSVHHSRSRRLRSGRNHAFLAAET